MMWFGTFAIEMIVGHGYQTRRRVSKALAADGFKFPCR